MRTAGRGLIVSLSRHATRTHIRYVCKSAGRSGIVCVWLAGWPATWNTSCIYRLFHYLMSGGGGGGVYRKPSIADRQATEGAAYFVLRACYVAANGDRMDMAQKRTRGSFLHLGNGGGGG